MLFEMNILSIFYVFDFFRFLFHWEVVGAKIWNMEM